ADKPHAMRLKIGQTADRVMQCPVEFDIDRVDREVASRRIFGPIGIEGDPSPPAEALDIAAQCRDLEMPRWPRVADNGSDRAVLDPGRDDLDACFFECRDDRL